MVVLHVLRVRWYQQRVPMVLEWFWTRQYAETLKLFKRQSRLRTKRYHKPVCCSTKTSRSSCHQSVSSSKAVFRSATCCSHSNSRSMVGLCASPAAHIPALRFGIDELRYYSEFHLKKKKGGEEENRTHIRNRSQHGTLLTVLEGYLNYPSAGFNVGRSHQPKPHPGTLCWFNAIVMPASNTINCIPEPIQVAFKQVTSVAGCWGLALARARNGTERLRGMCTGAFVAFHSQRAHNVRLCCLTRGNSRWCQQETGVNFEKKG